MNLAIVDNYEKLLAVAETFSNSALVPKQYQGRPGDVLVALQFGNEIGLNTLQSLQNIAVINGRPSLWGDAALALVRGSGKCEDFYEEFEGSGKEFKAIAVAKRDGREHRREFSYEDANRAGYLKKTGPWTTHPKRMMQMRARAFLLRDVFPDVLAGVALGEEQQDLEPIDVTPKNQNAFKAALSEIPSTSPTVNPSAEQRAADFVDSVSARDVESSVISRAAEAYES